MTPWRRRSLSKAERNILLVVARARGTFVSAENDTLVTLSLRGLVFPATTLIHVTDSGAFKRYRWNVSKRGLNAARQLAVRWSGRFYRSEWPPTALPRLLPFGNRCYFFFSGCV